MKYIFYIVLFLGLGVNSLQAQNTIDKTRLDSIIQVNKMRSDSIRVATKARVDSMKAVSAYRRDSIAAVRKEKEARKKELEKEKKRKLKNSDLENFTQTDSSPSDSIHLVKKAVSDSLKLVRESNTIRRKNELAIRRAELLAARRKYISPLTQEMSVGLKLASDGWSLFVNRGFIKQEENKIPFVWLDFSEKKSPKETRSINENFSIVYPDEPKPTSYKYGKVNNFYQFKIGVGNSKPLTGKLDKKSVVIHWIYGGGITLGLLKPYYLDLLLPEGNQYVRKYAKYTDNNKISFLDLNNQGTILGGSTFTKGIGETQIKPGLHARSGFYFDYTTSKRSFAGIEIGASAELYLQKIEIMKTTSNHVAFFNVYADIRFGKRWEVKE